MVNQISSYSLQLVAPVRHHFLGRGEVFELAERLYGPFDWGPFNPQSRVEMQTLEKLLQWLVETTGQQNMHLQVANSLDVGQFGAVSYYLLSCSSLHEFFVQLTRVQELLFARTEPLTMRHDEFGLYLEMKLSHAATPQVQRRIEYVFANILRMIQSIAGNQCAPERLELPWGDNDRKEDLEQAFECLVEYNSQKIRCVFDSRWMVENLANANPSMLEILRPEVDRMLNSYHKGATFIQRIYEILIGMDSLAGVTLTSIAQAMAMSESTLKRRLADEAATFKSLITSYRQTRTLELLGLQDIDYDHIAHQLGFSERASFERAFKGWYGLTPSKFRNLTRLCTISTPQIDLQQDNHLPSAPGVCRDVIVLLNDDQYEMSSLVGIIRQDPVLTGKIIGMANSAFFGATPVLELEQAIINVLGADTVMNLAIAMLAGSELTRHQPDLIDLGEFWTQSLIAAWWAEQLSLQAGNSKAVCHQHYLVALLAQIGLLLLASLRPKEINVVWPLLNESQSLQEQIRIEQRALGINRFEASSILLAHWKLPGAVVQQIQAISNILRKIHRDGPNVKIVLAGVVMSRNMDHHDLGRVLDQIQSWFPFRMDDGIKALLSENARQVIPEIRELAHHMCA
ncbi:HDOD domain-containing protein [Gynuella sp.]|uniref:HDOD domain-containing protein n=1 Tax=Gynuella sp. TaxID=2969146 RepID=UPI003D13D946